MVIRWAMCEATGSMALLHDVAKYRTVDEWLSDIMKGKAEFAVHDGGVQYQDKYYPIMYGMKPADDAEQALSFIGSLPEHVRLLCSDCITIVANAFEHELCITLDKEPMFVLSEKINH